MTRKMLTVWHNQFIVLVCLLSLPFCLYCLRTPSVLSGAYGGFRAIVWFLLCLVLAPVVLLLVHWLSSPFLSMAVVKNNYQAALALSGVSLLLVLLLWCQTFTTPHGLWSYASFGSQEFSQYRIEYHFFGRWVGIVGCFSVISAYVSHRFLSKSNKPVNLLQSLQNLFVLVPIALFYLLIKIHDLAIPQQSFIG